MPSSVRGDTDPYLFSAPCSIPYSARLFQGLSMKRRILMFINMPIPIRLVTIAVPP